MLFLSIQVQAGQIDVTFNGTALDLNDFCIARNYQKIIVDPDNREETIPNPETKTQFFIREIKEFVWNTVKSKRVNKAGRDGIQIEEAKTVEF